MDAQSHYDCTKFDILGVKLGMDSKEAVKLISDKTGAFPQGDGQGLNPYGKAKNLFKKKNTPLSKIITFKKDGVKVILNVKTTVPQKKDKKGAMSVWRIEYELENVPVNRKSMAELAIKKYGKPTHESKWEDRYSYTWCAPPKDNPDRCDVGEPVMNFSSATIKLEHFNYHKIVEAYFDDKKAVKPGF